MKKIFYTFLVVATALAACTKMDAYREDFTDGKEILYTGKADSVKLFPGRNRVMLQWIHAADPKVVSAKVYWNNRSDSTVTTIKRTAGVDTVQLMINSLPEGNYNFEIFTFDADNNRSVVVQKSGTVYGDTYQQTLLNRLVKSTDMKAGYAEVQWYRADQDALFTEVNFQNASGAQQSVRVLPTEDMTKLADYKAGTRFSFRTAFRPDSLALDTFYTTADFKGVTAEVTATYLKNAGFPFRAASMANGRFGTLADWTTNAAAKNISGHGGFDNYPGYGTMAFEYWGTPAINNGKIFQTVTLPAGKYSVQLTVESIAYPLPATYLVAAEGNDLPDAANYATALGFAKITDGSLNNKTIEAGFTLAAEKTVSIGVVAHMVTGTQNLRIKGFKLLSIAE